jgi:hypothetical protein
VWILTRVLFVLLALRLLVPPGICLCKLSSPASRLLADALGNEPLSLPAETEHHDDHHDGCPAGGLCEALGLRPAGPGPIELPLVAVLPVLADFVSTGAAASPFELPLAAAPCPPLCVTHCALRC